MTQSELIGYIAAFCVFITFYMRTMVPLRLAGLASNVFFIWYGYLTSAYPVLILHLVLLPLNAIRLRQMILLVKRVRVAMRDKANLEWFKPFSTARKVSKGDTLFRKGDKAEEMYLVVSGRFRLVEIDIDILPGELVGELGFLAPERARTATLTCIASGQLLSITYDQLRQLYFQNPQFGFYFLQLTTQRLFENIARLEQELAMR